MDNTQSVTVIVPAFNAGRWIEQTLKSIQAQTHRHWQVLVADDASSDETPHIVSKLAKGDRRIRLLRMPANTGGPAGPRNYALEQATSEWVAFCDADDIWHPQKLEVQLRIANQQDSDLVCTSIRDFTSSRFLADDPVAEPHAMPTEKIALWRLLSKNVIPNSSVMCRRRLIAQEGGFDESRKLVAVEDYDLWLRLVESGAKVTKVQVPLVNYRRLPDSLSARKMRLAKRVLLVLARHFARRERQWLFPLAAPCLMASYFVQAVYLRMWAGRL
jgi:teichuronic acid biosynthesis glycosyltransferase TuaG